MKSLGSVSGAKRTWSRSVAAALLGIVTLGSAGAARAATTATPMFFVTGGAAVDCKVVNTSTSSRGVRVQLMTGGGDIFSDTDGELILDAGQGAIVARADTSSNAPPDHYYCKFIGSSAFRGSLNVNQGFGGDQLVIPAQ